MKNFTKQNFKTNPLWVRLLIMAFMLLAGAGNAWGWNKLVIWKSGGSSSEVEFNNGTAQITLSETADYYFYINDNGNKKGLKNTEIKTSSNCKNMSFSGSADCGLKVASGETGLFTFTINSWNGSIPTVSVKYPSASTYLMGLGDWDNGKELPCTISLNAGTHQFKIKAGDTWYGNSGTMTSENSKNWTFGSDNQDNCKITINESGDYYFYVVWTNNLPTVSVTYPCEPSNNNTIRIECVHTAAPNLYAWDTSGNLNGAWPGSEMHKVDNIDDNIYYSIFTNTNSTQSINIIFSGNDLPQTSDIEDLKWGKVYRYTRDGVLVYSDCLPPDCEETEYNISFAGNATSINKGATLQASVSPNSGIGTITWSSSDSNVATVNSSGVITGKKGGKATITATIANGDTYCGGTATEEITIKETPTITITGDTYGCNENKTLTATVTGLESGTNYTIKWYKENTETDAIHTGSKYTATESGTYIAQVTGEYINDTSDDFVFTKYPATSVPQITLASNSICAGSTTTLTINDYNKNSYSYKLYNDNNVVGSPVFNNGVYTLSSAGNYYVTATPISGVCQVESAKQQTAASLTVTSVTLALNPTSAPICSGTTLADIDTYVEITTNGDRVAWFEANSGGNALNETDEIRQATYYAEATLNGCTSERVAFKVTELLNVPAKPVITPSDAAICSGNIVTLTLTEKVAGETYKIGDISVFTSSNTYQTPPLNDRNTYTITATNQCGSTNSEPVTINVTKTPVITADKLVTTIGSPITLTSNIDAKWTTTGGILNPNSGATSSVEFTSQNNGRYIITASNTANNITCSTSKEVSVQNAFYVYIRRPKSGDDVYDYWYGTTNDAEKGNAPWFKEGTPNYGSMEDTNYGGVGPVESFTDCNDYTWDAFEFAGGYFYIHAPNTGGSNGWATFTKETYIESLSGDVYYYISSFKEGEQGSVLSESATTPERAPEIITPVTSLNPASGILCSGSQATLTVTNPQNDYTYTLMYKGAAQGEPISGNNEVEFTVIEAGSYAVQAKVQSNSGCTSTASSSASQIKVIATNIKFDATEYTTTPWVPVTVVIEAPSGYEFIYNDANLTSITPEADKPIKKENGHEYTYTFPRPTDWSIGNSQSGDGYAEKPYTITATIKNAEQCGTATAIVKLQDEGNDKCILP